ncbi:RagB/SusD family nutrient uptake outer membrane protein [Puia sp. P3]|uniref:RagB/SusD family nutrient uptake outer membrane protein n=1 Tax=Puia sp. P3 TaxID=3423952 RepID=UPI003D666F10
MKKNYYLLALSVVLVTACSKKDKPTPPPAPPTGSDVATAIGKQLSATDTLSDFNAAFKTSTLADQDVSGGVTIFAPSNIAFGGSAAPTGELLPDSSLLKDYIVKGLLKPTDLTAGKTLTTLSGKTLIITVSGTTVLVNGVAINTTTPYTSANFILYSAVRLLNAAAPLAFTVWDASQWSASQPKGVLSSGATVSLYATQADFAAGTKALYSTTTDANGVATFNGIKAGTYYVVAARGSVDNVFKYFTEVVNGSYVGFFSDSVDKNTGAMIWRDTNGDGKSDVSDIGTVPALQATASKDAAGSTTILMGYYTKPLQSAADVQQIFTAVNTSLIPAYGYLLAMDAVLSDDANCSGSASYCPFDNFTVTPFATQIQSTFLATYSQLGQLNRVVNDVPNISTIAADQRADFIAQARGMRGYIYLELMMYFGGLPIQHDITPVLYPGASRSTTDDLYAYIKNDLTAAAADLPVTRNDGNVGLTKAAATGLLARAALWKKDYAAVAGYTQSIINSTSYSLGTLNAWFTAGPSAENLWSPGFSAILPTYNWLYSGVFPSTTVQIVPVIRYGQVLLMDAEAQLYLGSYSTASADINLVLTRRGQSASFTGLSDGLTALQAASQMETYRQGERFQNLLRWGNAQTVLGASGYNPSKNNLLPLPGLFLAQYPGIVQNPGY